MMHSILSKKRSVFNSLFFSFILPCVVFLFMWVLEAKKIDTSLILPYPQEVLISFVKLLKTNYFWQLLFVTTIRVLRSFLISFFLSMIFGVFAGKYINVRRFLSFPMGIIKATPVVSFILMAIFWFSTDSVPVFIGILMTLPIMIGGVISGINNIDKNLELMCSIYNINNKQRLFSFYIPSIAPYVINSTLTSFSLTWKVIVAAEVIALPQLSVGFALQTSKVQIETANVFAWTFAIVVTSFLLENFLSILLKNIVHIKKHTKPSVSSLKQQTFESHNLQSTNSSTSIDITNLSMTRGDKKLYTNFSVHFAANKVTAFIAPSGAGKTTLFDLISGFLTPDSGKICINGTIKKGPSISYLFQEPRLLPSQTVLQNIELPLLNIFTAKKARKRALYYIAKVGLIEKTECYPSKLSGGEKQRVALARAFAYPSKILLMDEAFQSQDMRLKLQLGRLFKTLLLEETKTVIMVTHDIHEAITLSDRIIVLDNSPLEIKLDRKITPSETSQIEKDIIAVFS